MLQGSPSPVPALLLPHQHQILNYRGRVGSNSVPYRHSATFPENTWPQANGEDVPWGRVDWTDHGRPFDHPNPYIHEFRYNPEQVPIHYEIASNLLGDGELTGPHAVGIRGEGEMGRCKSYIGIGV